MKTYKINGVDYQNKPLYLEKDGFMVPVTAENFTIEVINVEDVESPALTALKGILAAEITALNTKYPGLNLLISDNLVTAIPKLIASDATKAEVVYLNTLYQAIKEA